MAFSIYKPGQGYWTRTLSAIGAAMLVLSCAGWLWNQLSTLPASWNPLYIQAGVAAGVVLGFGIFLLWLFNKPSIVDFMIATEAEMKKVSWPSRSDLISLTIIVIVGTFMIVGLLFVVDVFFAWLFTQAGVLQTS